MGCDLGEAWIENAVEHYRKIDELRAELNRLIAAAEVLVSSPDGLVEVVVTARGEIKDVRVRGDITAMEVPRLSASLKEAVVAAADAAGWARNKLHAEVLFEAEVLIPER